MTSITLSHKISVNHRHPLPPIMYDRDRAEREVKDAEDNLRICRQTPAPAGMEMMFAGSIKRAETRLKAAVDHLAKLGKRWK